MGSKHKTNFADKLHASPSIHSAAAAPRIDPTGARPLFSSAQLAEAKERQRLLLVALPLFEDGLPQSKVAPMLGISPATMSRLLNLCPTKGNATRNAVAKCRRLIKLPARRLAPKAASGGQVSAFASLLKVKPVLRELRRCYLTHRAAGKPQSVCIRAALADLGYSDNVLNLPSLARKLRNGTQPAPLVEYLKQSFPRSGPSARRPDLSAN